MRTLGCLAGLLAALLVAGCRDKGRGDSATRPNPVYSAPEAILPGDLPPGWKAGPESSRREASYVVEGEGGAVADVSLMILAGQPGGMLRNVNRWRRQLAQPPLNETSFEQALSWTTIPVGEAAVIDIAGEVDEVRTAFDGRIAAVVVEHPAHTWFFVMRGNADLVEGQRGAFLEWVGRVKRSGADGPAAGVPPEAPLPVPAVQVSPEDRPTWRVPDGWTEAPRGESACARFAVTGPDGRPGEVAVLLLEGAGGGVLANVNRWRRRAGLGAITEEGLAGRIQSVFSGGVRLSLTRVAGPQGSVVAAWMQRDEGTWVFELAGPASVVEVERPRFARFLQGVGFAENP